MKHIINEPLIHFLFLGLTIFLVFSLFSGSRTDERTIVFDSFDLNNIMSKWEMQWNRPPTKSELENLVNHTIRQELLYREALRLNLDHNDEIIKRRLAQKMESFGNDLTRMRRPSDEELQGYFESHKEKYRSDYNYTFHHVLFSSDEHENPLEVAAAALSTATKSDRAALKNQGDKMPLSNYFESKNEVQLRATLGSSFTDKLTSLSLNTWDGPVQSGFGYHLVFIEERIEPNYLDPDAIKNRILYDFNYDMQQILDSALVEGLKGQYEFQVDLDAESFEPDVIRIVESSLKAQ